MVLGKEGLRLEAWKFGVYIIIPIAASIYFNNPETQRYWADYFQFLKYPANPNTNLKEQFEEMQRKAEEEREQRKAYAEQIRRLQEAAQKSRREREDIMKAEESNEKRGWFRWFGTGSKQQEDK